MSSSSDIEKLFDHFGGDASAYQEIGRENEARSARTRWPLLVTLDLTQPAIPAIGHSREPAGKALAQDAAPAAGLEDTTPKDAISVTRAKAPLFTRSHRRDIPPVAVAARPAATSGASRFGALETKDEAAAQSASAASAAPATPVAKAPAASAATASIPPLVPPTSIPPVAQVRPPATPVTQALADVPPTALTPRVGIPPLTPRAATPAPLAPAPAWTQAPAPVPAWTQTATQAAAQAPAWAQAPARTYATAPTAPKPPASILGKLFAREPEPAPPQPAAPSGGAAPLQSVFDRLRGKPAQTAAAPASAPHAATPAASNSWLVNGPRRS